MVEENKISLVSSLPERVFWNYWALPHCLLCLLFFPQATVPFTHVMITSTARVSAVQFLLSFIKKYCHVWHLGFRLYHLFLSMDHYHLSDIFDTNRKMIILAKADTRMMPFHCSVLDGDCILLPASFREHYTNEKWFIFIAWEIELFKPCLTQALGITSQEWILPEKTDDFSWFNSILWEGISWNKPK